MYVQTYSSNSSDNGQRKSTCGVVEESSQCAEPGTVGFKQSCHSYVMEKVLTCLILIAFTELSPENQDGWLPSLGIPAQNKERKFKQTVVQQHKLNISHNYLVFSPASKTPFQHQTRKTCITLSLSIIQKINNGTNITTNINC
jgi:hypothetical protein